MERYVLATIAALGAISSCARTAEEARAVTYPPAFQYVDRGDVRTVMGGLAQDVIALDELIRHDPQTDADRSRIIATLASLQMGAVRLGQGDGASNMAHFSYNAARLRRDLELALVGAAKEPPVDTEVGRLLVAPGQLLLDAGPSQFPEQ